MHPQIKLARKAFDALEPLNNIDWTSHREKIFDLCKAEEKSHRGSGPDFNGHHTADTAGVSDCAKLFAVKRIAGYLMGEKFPSGKDYLHTQKSCFYAAGLVDEHAETIRKAWANFEIRELCALNYTDVVKVKPAERQAA